ncbi:deoxyribodipyrimidine photolyase [Aggregatimonas sangjinii]|uniref:Deoxyribodipyrimidine photolyase n=1 Tax=Aggregatimonas sangjinii TaxID=2583587 RepID=A0A5B7SPK8_9FLAO|nr:FAD-binding domain-containing protein [Aggregatimonas sangjinii]QCW98910.1 deoxyribodipyrimidine photolyase [Aggregatimonas sangjinii]
MASNYDVTKVHFPSAYSEILQRVESIDPSTYARTRNYISGAVSYLSPYISRGVISTKFVLQQLLQNGHSVKKSEKFIQELAWRDYWQQVWMAKGNAIDNDLRHLQTDVQNHEISTNLVKGETGIKAIDRAVAQFYDTGYLHNHVRMYIAAISCNMGKSHWKIPAQWMYYHLLDGDWASNALSWQWVAGCNRNKKYVANQENINKYCHTTQQGTFLDIPYDAFSTMGIPEVLDDTHLPELITPLPEQKEIKFDKALPTQIYNYYNLDPNWKGDLSANRILLLEPSHFAKYPIGQKSMDFMLALGENIENLQVFVGEFDELLAQYPISEVYFNEHPTNKNYRGKEEARDWMFSVTGYFPSFFAFWKKCKKELNY